jgi:hypothetical protein
MCNCILYVGLVGNFKFSVKISLVGPVSRASIRKTMPCNIPQ